MPQRTGRSIRPRAGRENVRAQLAAIWFLIELDQALGRHCDVSRVVFLAFWRFGIAGQNRLDQTQVVAISNGDIKDRFRVFVPVSVEET